MQCDCVKVQQRGTRSRARAWLSERPWRASVGGRAGGRGRQKRQDQARMGASQRARTQAPPASPMDRSTRAAHKTVYQTDCGSIHACTECTPGKTPTRGTHGTMQRAKAWCCALTFGLADSDISVPRRNSDVMKVRWSTSTRCCRAERRLSAVRGRGGARRRALA